MRMLKALYSRNYEHGQCVSGKEGVRGLESIQNSVDALIQRLECNITNAEKDCQQRPEIM